MEHLSEHALAIQEVTIIVTLTLASIVAIIAKRLRLPYTIALVITGVGFSLTNVIPELLPGIKLTSDLIFYIFLPALLFEAAYHMPFEELRRNIRTIATLAIPGVVLSMFIVGFIAHTFAGLDWTIALLFGALISATDPISVVALFKELGVPKRLSTIVEGESLFNDGTSVVLFNIIIMVVGMGAEAGTGSPDIVGIVSVAVLQFVKVAFGGAVLGLIVGWLFSEFVRPIDDYLIEITLTVVQAYGSYLLAEAIGVSGVIAVVVAGLVLGNYGATGGMSPTTRLAISSLWEYFVFVVNSLIFLLIGLQSDLLGNLGRNFPFILWGIFGVLLSRAVVIYILTILIRRMLKRDMPTSWSHILFWGGLRGSLSLALVLTITGKLTGWEVLQSMAFGVVLFSLLVQGLSIKSLIKRLGLAKRSTAQEEYERLRGELLSLREAWRMLEEFYNDGLITPTVWEELHQEYRLLGQRLSMEIGKLQKNHAQLRQEEIDFNRREALRVQKNRLLELVRRGIISEDIYRDLVKGVNEKMEAL